MLHSNTGSRGMQSVQLLDRFRNSDFKTLNQHKIIYVDNI